MELRHAVAAPDAQARPRGAAPRGVDVDVKLDVAENAGRLATEARVDLAVALEIGLVREARVAPIRY